MIKSLPSFKTGRRGTSQDQGLRYGKGRKVIGAMSEHGNPLLDNAESELKPRRQTSVARQL